ncbi:hypothetical protein D929_01690 [Enterococcus faecalis 02-MB-P-10]|nr:hypothetical protein D929_01690 [Enterococcus faecalis 02-MB-P-10]
MKFSTNISMTVVFKEELAPLEESGTQFLYRLTGQRVERNKLLPTYRKVKKSCTKI